MIVLNLAAEVFKAWFVPREARNQYNPLENSTDASVRFLTMLCGLQAHFLKNATLNSNPTDPRVDCSHQSNYFQNSASESRPNFTFKIVIKLQPQSLDQPQLQNLDQSTTSKS